jgi:methylated-DNA-[protein]-cysteine S-methyltransferase
MADRAAADRGDERAIGTAIREATSPAGVDLGALGDAIAARAAAEGLVEVAVGRVETPVGTLLAASTERGLVRLSFPRPDREEMIDELAAVIGPRVVELPDRFDRLRRQLEEYFEGRRRQFDLPLDWRLTVGFGRRVLVETARIPYGETRSYAQLAAAAGSPRAYRAAGSALGANPIPIVVPCHRVLRSGGALGGYGGGLAVKRRLLAIEGALEPPR